jgi:RsiW-degrading membrane proteinase PrsW (M82 family)
MHTSLVVAPVLLPILFWAAYHYHNDRYLPEPLPHLLLAFLLGGVAAALSQGLYQGLDWIGLRHDAGYLADTSSAQLFAYSLLVIGPVEEFSKLILFVLIIVRFKEFDEALDGIIYASFLALGYAGVENWQYLDYLTPLEAVARGFASPVVHIVFASIWGYRIALAHIAGRTWLPAALLGFAIAAVLHGLYDFAVLLQPLSALPGAALLIVSIWVWRLRLLRRLHNDASGPTARTPAGRKSGT